jgi:hypothetical protein
MLKKTIKNKRPSSKHFSLMLMVDDVKLRRGFHKCRNGFMADAMPCETCRKTILKKYLKSLLKARIFTIYHDDYR